MKVKDEIVVHTAAKRIDEENVHIFQTIIGYDGKLSTKTDLSRCKIYLVIENGEKIQAIYIVDFLSFMLIKQNRMLAEFNFPYDSEWEDLEDFEL